MKKYLLLMFFLAFAVNLSAQDLPPIKASKTENTKAISKKNAEVDNQIKKALMKDEGLQKKTIGFLKGNPDTSSALKGLMMKNNDTSTSGLMKSILGNKDLASAAINYISSNPDLLQKAMKIVGL